MSRAWSLALPVLTVIVVCYALLVAGVPRSIVAARVYGGPTEGASTLSLRVESVQRAGESETPFWDGPVSVLALPAHAKPVMLSVPRAESGVADIALPLASPVHGKLHLELRGGSGSSLANGDLELDRSRWAAHARRRGGWIRGRADRELVVSVAPERGVLVVGAADFLLLRVERQGNPASGVALNVSAEGARLSADSGLRTDVRGRARIRIEATELNPTVRVEARDEARDEAGAIDTGVPLVPGGFFARVSNSELRVESAIERRDAFFSVVTDSGRVTGGRLELTANDRGGSFATSLLPALPHPSWVVVSSEVDQNSVAAIGWPLDVGTEPAQTFDVPDVLLLDGLPAAFAREQTRRSRVRWLSAAFIALAFLLSVVLLVVRVRAADRDISQHLREGLDAETTARVAPRRSLALLVALLSIGLGFVALGLIVAARSR